MASGSPEIGLFQVPQSSAGFPQLGYAKALSCLSGLHVVIKMSLALRQSDFKHLRACRSQGFDVLRDPDVWCSSKEAFRV